MEPGGIIMIAFTLFGVLVLMIASVTMDNGTSQITAQDSHEPASDGAESKKAA
jgi:hypothetical protein